MLNLNLNLVSTLPIITEGETCPAELISTTSCVNYMKFDGNLTSELGTNDVTQVGGPPSYTTGKFGQSIDTKSMTYLTVNANTQPANTPNWTIAYWRYHDVVGDPLYVIDLIWDTWNYAGPGARQGFRLFPYRVSEGVQQLFATMGNDNVFIAYPKVAYNEWHHFAVTLNTSRQVKVYVDGVLQGTGSWAGETINRPGLRPRIFGSQQGANGMYAGDVDELNIYNRVLSLSEIQALAAGTCPLTTP